MLRGNALETDSGFTSPKSPQHRWFNAETTTDQLHTQGLVSSGLLCLPSPEDELCKTEATSVKRKLSKDGPSHVIPLLESQSLSNTSVFLALNRCSVNSAEDPITSRDHFPCPSSTVTSDSTSQAIRMSGLEIDRTSERRRSERRKNPYPQPGLIHQYPAPWSHTVRTSLPHSAACTTVHLRNLLSPLESRSFARRMIRHAPVTLIPLQSTTNPTVSNGGIPFSPLGIQVSPADADAVHYLMTHANHVNNLFGAPQREREKAKSDWVQKWLITSYKKTKDSTVPRQAMYSSYTESCKAYNMINSASFGKAVRTAFPNIKTRRLGRRGDSRYHYISITARLDCEARRLNEYGESTGALHQILSDGESALQRMDDDENVEDYSNDESYQDNSRQSLSRGASSTSVGEDQHEINGQGRSQISTLVRPSATDSSNRSSIVNAVGFPSREMEMHLKNADAKSMWIAFVEHLDKLLSYFEEYSLDHVEMTMRMFWPSMTLYRDVSQTLELSMMISKAMAVCYNEMISMLIANVFSSRISAVSSTLRMFAKCMETICHVSLKSYDSTFSEQKIESAARAGHLMLRFCDIQQLTVALVSIISDAARVKDMLRAWETIDFETLLDQAALACNCQPTVLETILEDFREILRDALNQTDMAGVATVTLRRIGERLEEVTTLPELGLSPRGILIRVSFITSQIMRDMTLRSDPAFGLFQLLKTWVDDWCGLLILRRIALCSGSFEAFDANATFADNLTPSGGHSNTRLP